MIFIGDYGCTICHAAFLVVGKWWETKTGLNLFYVEGPDNPQTWKMLGAMPFPSIALMHQREVYGVVYGSAVSVKELELLLNQFTATINKPKFIRRVKNFIHALGRLIRSKKLGAGKALRNARLSKCNACIYNKKGICADQSCGCIIKVKASILSETCPKGFWQ